MSWGHRRERTMPTRRRRKTTRGKLKSQENWNYLTACCAPIQPLELYRGKSTLSLLTTLFSAFFQFSLLRMIFCVLLTFQFPAPALIDFHFIHFYCFVYFYCSTDSHSTRYFFDIKWFSRCFFYFYFFFTLLCLLCATFCPRPSISSLLENFSHQVEVATVLSIDVTRIAAWNLTDTMGE